MKSIEAVVTVTPDGKLNVRAEKTVDITPGEYRATLEIDERVSETKERLPLIFSSYDIPWPAGLSLSREDMYGDNGR